MCDSAVREEAGGQDTAKASASANGCTVTPRASLSGASPVSDAVYLRHLSAVLDERLADIHPEDF